MFLRIVVAFVMGICFGSNLQTSFQMNQITICDCRCEDGTGPTTTATTTTRATKTKRIDDEMQDQPTVGFSAVIDHDHDHSTTTKTKKILLHHNTTDTATSETTLSGIPAIKLVETTASTNSDTVLPNSHNNNKHNLMPSVNEKATVKTTIMTIHEPSNDHETHPIEKQNRDGRRRRQQQQQGDTTTIASQGVESVVEINPEGQGSSSNDEEAVIEAEDSSSSSISSASATLLIDCGCPQSCDKFGLYNGNGKVICRNKILRYMNKRNMTQLEACTMASKGKNPACDLGCRPNVCKLPEIPLTPLEQMEQRSDKMIMVDAPPKTSLQPWKNLTTMAFSEGSMYSGFRNQMQVFTILMLESIQQGHGQFLVETIRMKDLHGTNRYFSFHEMWDVEHWNVYYPQLPRLVLSDPELHDQYNPSKRKPYHENGNSILFNGTVVDGVPTRPFYFGPQATALRRYFRYSKGKGEYLGPRGTPNPADILMQTNALRPHPDMRAIVDKFLTTITRGEKASNSSNDRSAFSSKPTEYMALRKYFIST
jgi:hypothetical protein